MALFFISAPRNG